MSSWSGYGIASRTSLSVTPLTSRPRWGPSSPRPSSRAFSGYIETGKREGARLVCGGGRPAGMKKGWYVQPTIFEEVPNTATIAREEIFGPVLAVIKLRDPR